MAADAPPRSTEIGKVVGTFRTPLGGIALFSGMVNLLYLTGSFFMLEVYDRVIPSRSVPTLVALALMAFTLYVFQGLLDLIRQRVLVRIGAVFDEQLGRRVFDTIVRLPLIERRRGDSTSPLRDLDTLRAFLSGGGLCALFDLPWIPIYVAICYLFHPALGLTVLGGAIILFGLGVATEVLNRKPVRAVQERATARNGLAETSRRNAEVVYAMGMGGRIADVWAGLSETHNSSQQTLSDISTGIGAITKVVRMTLQSAVLGIGAYLVINQMATSGVMIAASILTSRALAPVEMAIGQWKGIVQARQAWGRLTELFTRVPPLPAPMRLAPPRSSLVVEDVAISPPGSNDKLVVQHASMTLKAGSAAGVIGPSGCGKSTLARSLVGVWHPKEGSVRLDGATLDQWSAEAMGRFIGYLPQDVELFAGTIAQNISRFDRDADPEAIVKAASAAGVHDMILHLDDGYETMLADGGIGLSGGQRQRIGRARWPGST
jgi:ATP-binding cassette subfamily C protein